MGERAGYLGSAEASSDPAVIADEIEQTRTEMSGTIEAIQDRLAPERLTDQAVGAATEVTEQARDAAKEVAEFAIAEAKAAVQELTEQARRAGLELTEQGKMAVQELTVQTKAAVRDATVGRVENMAAQTRDTAQHVRADLITTVKQNPIPAALAAIGLSWLWTHRTGSSGSGHDHQYRASSGGQTGYPGYRSDYPAYGGSSDWNRGDRGQSIGQAAGQAVGQAQQAAGQAVGQVGETAGQAVDQVQGIAGQAVGQVQQTAGQVVGQVQETAGQVGHQAKGAFWQMLDSNPMAVGALGAVLGGVTALMLPETEKENQILGDARDRVMDRVQQVAGDAVDKVHSVAEEVGETAAKEAKYQGLTADPGGAAQSS